MKPLLGLHFWKTEYTFDFTSRNTPVKDRSNILRNTASLFTSPFILRLARF